MEWAMYVVTGISGVKPMSYWTTIPVTKLLTILLPPLLCLVSTITAIIGEKIQSYI